MRMPVAWVAEAGMALPLEQVDMPSMHVRSSARAGVCCHPRHPRSGLQIAHRRCPLFVADPYSEQLWTGRDAVE